MSDTVTVHTTGGKLTVGPGGRIEGFWQIVRRELCTNEQVRALCAGAQAGRRPERDGKGIERNTLKRWRDREGFPEPVLTLGVRGQAVELWSRSDVDAWLRRRKQAARRASGKPR